MTRYFECYHPFLKLLDPGLSPDQYYSRSPLLFWAIVTTAARRYPEEPSLFAGISRALTKLTWASISNRPHTRFMIEAILLQLAWPIPTATIANDNTYLLSSIAVQGCVQLGLHVPDDHQEFTTLLVKLSPEEIKLSRKTWVACNIVSQKSVSKLCLIQLCD